MQRILVADCAPAVFSAVRSAFPGTEFEILAFSDGTEVIEALEMVQPDVILLNLFLQSKDGYDVCHFLNNQERFKKIPVFLLKGAFDPVDEERLSGLEYRELIEEPFDSGRLARKVREVVGEDSDPLTLPEEPVLAGDFPGSHGLEEKMRNLVAEEFLKNEDRIVDRLKTRILAEVRKSVHNETG